MNIQLSDHFTYKKLIRFVLPSVMMVIFMSVYGIVDGFFVSNFVGQWFAVADKRVCAFRSGRGDPSPTIFTDFL